MPTETLVNNSFIGDFKILRKIGEGGFANVYAVSPRNLPLQTFALKLVKDAKYNDLLVSEAGILQKLSHSQIPVAISVGTAEENCKYLVMSYAPKTLAEEMSPGHKSSIEKAIFVTKHILSVMGYAHRNGIIHKDLKPGNIGYDRDGNPMLLDFNVAKELLQTAKNDVKHSAIDSDIIEIGGLKRSVLGGTEGYSAPEQRKIPIDNETYEVTERSDIYAVGVLMYHMLAGFLPHGNYVPISKLRSDVPKWVDEVIGRALKPKPTDRYCSTTEMANSIQHFEQGLHSSVQHKIAKAGQAVFDACLKKPVTGVVTLTKKLAALVWFTASLPFRIIHGLYGFGWYRVLDNRNADAAVLVLILSIAAWITSIIAIPFGYSWRADQAFIKENAGRNLTGTIICRYDTRIRFFKAADTFKETVPYTEIVTPAHIEHVTYLGDQQLAWVSRHAGSPSDFIYVGSLKTGSFQIIVRTEDLSDKSGLLGGTPRRIQQIVGNTKSIAFQLDNSVWYSTNLDGKNINSTVNLHVERTYTNISPDGILKADYGAHLYITRSADRWGSVRLPFGGYEPIWITDEVESRR